MAIYETDSFVWRTRRGGKTIMLSVLETFWSLIRFGESYPGVVVHRCPTGDQLRMLFYWFKKNPFITKIDKHEYLVHVFNSEPIWAAMTTANNSDGYGCSVLYEDEWGTEDANGLKATQLESTRNFAIEGSFRGKRRLKASTVHYDSVGHKDLNRLQEIERKEKKQLIHIMTWDDCIKSDGTSWIPDEEKDKIISEHFFDPAFVKEMFECILVPKGGLFFSTDQWCILGQHKTYDADYMRRNRIIVNKAGLDWNGDASGHVLVLGNWNPQTKILFLMQEQIFDTTQSVHDWIQAHPDIAVEVEGKPKRDGYNAGFSQHLMELGTNCFFQSWEKESKDSRLAILQHAIIIIDPSCKWAIKNFKEAIFDPKSLVPKLLKTSDQHGLDGALHIVSGEGYLDFPVAPKVPYQGGITDYEKRLDMWRGY